MSLTRLEIGELTISAFQPVLCRAFSPLLPLRLDLLKADVFRKVLE